MGKVLIFQNFSTLITFPNLETVVVRVCGWIRLFQNSTVEQYFHLFKCDNKFVFDVSRSGRQFNYN